MTEVWRMRTINEAISFIKEHDSGMAVTASAIRKLCKESKIHCILIGNRYLLDIDGLLAFFSTKSVDFE